jgi:hypothetical protein
VKTGTCTGVRSAAISIVLTALDRLKNFKTEDDREDEEGEKGVATKDENPKK